MSRSSYTDDYGEDYPGQLELYRANVQRSIQGRNGQARLRELRDALLALPVKALEADIFAEGTREQPRVCALGAWALQTCGGDPAAARALVGPRDTDDYAIAAALQPFQWPLPVVREAIYQNDEGRHDATTPAERYAYVLRWVNAAIR